MKIRTEKTPIEGEEVNTLTFGGVSVPLRQTIFGHLYPFRVEVEAEVEVCRDTSGRWCYRWNKEERWMGTNGADILETAYKELTRRLLEE